MIRFVFNRMDASFCFHFQIFSTCSWHADPMFPSHSLNPGNGAKPQALVVSSNCFWCTSGTADGADHSLTTHWKSNSGDSTPRYGYDLGTTFILKGATVHWSIPPRAWRLTWSHNGEFPTPFAV